MPSVHYRRSPSASTRWLACPGSIPLSEGIPRKESSYAQEGTEAHTLAEMMLTGKCAFVSDNREMRDAVQVYVDEINSYRRNYKVLAEYNRANACVLNDPRSRGHK